ncbi:MAG: futalosine hydrolase [Nitrospirota bacterium]|nr:futalosine hydrolase [Nitrospirota bacterium]
MIALLTSVDAEADILRQSMENVNRVTIGTTTVFEGMLAGKQVVLCVAGMGKVNAAHGATIMITRYAPAVLFVLGVGGAYPSSGARIGDVVLAREEIAGDEGVLTNDGFKDTEFIGIPLLKTTNSTIFNTYPAPAPVLDQALAALRSCGPSVTVHAGPFITLSTCTGTAARARELEERYQGLCENMEGAAAAQVAELHNVPWLEVRGISNIVEDRDLSRWDIPRAARAAQQAVMHILGSWQP